MTNRAGRKRTFRCPDPLWKRARLFAAVRGETVGTLARRALLRATNIHLLPFDPSETAGRKRTFWCADRVWGEARTYSVLNDMRLGPLMRYALFQEVARLDAEIKDPVAALHINVTSVGVVVGG